MRLGVRTKWAVLRTGLSGLILERGLCVLGDFLAAWGLEGERIWVDGGILNRGVSLSNMWLQEFIRNLQAITIKLCCRRGELTFENYFMAATHGAVGLDSACSTALWALEEPLILPCYCFILFARCGLGCPMEVQVKNWAPFHAKVWNAKTYFSQPLRGSCVREWTQGSCFC